MIRRAAMGKTRSRRGAVRVQGARKGTEVGLYMHTHKDTGPSFPPGHLLPSSPSSPSLPSPHPRHWAGIGRP